MTTSEQLQWLKDNCYHWWTDNLDCSKSLARQHVERTFDEALPLFDNPLVYKAERDINNKQFIEVMVCTRGHPTNFIWFQLEKDKEEEINKRIKLIYK